MGQRAAIYVRISRDRVGAGLGVERQEQDCRELAAVRGWTVTTVHRDNDISAYSGKPRPGYRALLDDIETGRVDLVIAWHTDRLHRSPSELEDYIAACERRGVPTHTVKAGPLDLASPSGRMVARTLGAVARYEVEHMVERQRAAKDQAAAAGKYRGGPRPYGYEADGVTPVPGEAAELLRACEAVLSGVGLTTLARDMNSRGLRTSTGAPWTSTALRRVLLRPRNAGLVEAGGEEIGSACWPAIVPEDIWRGAATVLRDPGRRTQFSSLRRWLGTGLYACHCGAGVRANGDGHGLVSYHCLTNKHLTRAAVPLDTFVSGLVTARLSQPDAVGLLDPPSVDTAALRARATTLRHRLDELARMFAAGEVTGAQLTSGTATVRGELHKVESALADAHRGNALAGLVGVEDVSAAWERIGLDRQRAVVDTLMTVTLLPSKRGRPSGWRPGQSYFDPESVEITWKT